VNPIPLYSTFEAAFPVSASLAICTYGEIDNETISVAKCFRMNKKLGPIAERFICDGCADDELGETSEDV
jgi:hypothetical protein